MAAGDLGARPGRMARAGTRRGNHTSFTQRPSYRWVALTMAFFSVFGAIGLGRFGYSAILPSMQQALGITSAAAGALASWNLAGYVLSAAVGGLLASRFGPRLVVSIGSVIAAAGMLITGIAGGVTAAAAGRLLTGLGSGTVLVPSVALMSAWFELRRRGMASAIVSSGASLALVIAGPVVPRIIELGGAGGWRLAWYFFAALTFAMGILTWIVQRNGPGKAMSAPILRGSAWTADTPVGQPQNVEEAAVADVLSRWPKSTGERRQVQRSSGLSGIYRSGFAWHLGFVYFAFGFGYVIYFTFFQKRLTADLGMSATAAGNIFLVVGIFSLICGVLWGSISDRIGRGRALALNYLLQGTGSALFAWWTDTPGLVISAIFCGLTALAIPGLMGAACGDRFGPVLASASLGFVTIFIGVGQVLGPYVAGKLADIFGNLTYSYVLSAGIFYAGAVLAAFLPDHRRTAAKPAPAQPGPQGASG
ncbi:MAG: MFS transporter [Thermoleophilia bacterium]|nr:MFS transporter [Thermoleophilia bacterium]